MVACEPPERLGESFLAPVLEEPPGFPEHPGPRDAECLTPPAIGQVEDGLLCVTKLINAKSAIPEQLG
jgi:hypothetical protein